LGAFASDLGQSLQSIAAEVAFLIFPSETFSWSCAAVGVAQVVKVAQAPTHASAMTSKEAVRRSRRRLPWL
jgi:hypothetical protein